MVNEGSTVGSKGGIVRMPQLVPLRGGSRNFSGEVFINLQVLLLDDVFRPFEWRGAFQGLPDILWRGSVCAIPFGHRRRQGAHMLRSEFSSILPGGGAPPPFVVFYYLLP